ncbi:hypothetical protein GGR40_004341 [Novosphingobium gossypii]
MQMNIAAPGNMIIPIEAPKRMSAVTAAQTPKPMTTAAKPKQMKRKMPLISRMSDSALIGFSPDK